MTVALKDAIPAPYKRVARAVGLSLYLGDTDHWHKLTLVLCKRLEPTERAALAWSVLRSLTPDQIHAVNQSLAPSGAGQTMAPLFNHMDQAAFWADMANGDELDAYCLASFNRMAPARQAAFLDFVQGRAAA